MKKLLTFTAVALASAAFSAQADTFSVTGTSFALGPGFSGPATVGTAGTMATIGNLTISGFTPGTTIRYDFIGSEAGFVDRFFGPGGTGAGALFTTPGGSTGTFVPGSGSAGPFAATAIPIFSFMSPLGTVVNGANPPSGTAVEPNFGVILQGSTTAFLLFNDAGAGFDRDFDDLIVRATISNIPEPSTYALLLAGLGIIFGIMRRRSNVA